MAKPNINVATREELVDVAGLRPDLADEILKLQRKGNISLDMLDEVPGVGPVTLEQLRKSLDFSSEAGRDERHEGKATLDKAAEAGKRTVEQVAETGKRASGQAAEATRAAVDQTAGLARQGLQVVQRATGSAGELQREMARQSTEGASELGRMLLSIGHEQSQQNAEMLRKLVATVDWNQVMRAVDWEQIFELQGEFLRSSLERTARLTQRYMELTQALMSATTSAAQTRMREAA